MVQLRRIAALAAAASLAVPAGAFAQGAGDTQYSDPFEGEQRADSGGGGGNGNGNGNANAGTGSSGAGTGGGGEDGPALSRTPPGGGPTESRAAETRTPEGELPRTGADPGLMALLGLGFVLTGAGLRVRVRRPLA